jgi:DNA topoisomerase-3
MQEDREVQKAISNIGIGTPAIRASIIETLLSTNYIIRKGLKVYGFVKDKKITTAE